MNGICKGISINAPAEAPVIVKLVCWKTVVKPVIHAADGNTVAVANDAGCPNLIVKLE